MFQVCEINSLDELKSYRLTWRELWERGRQRRVQSTYEWFAADWNHATPDRQMKVLVASLGGKVIGLLPLVIKTATTTLGDLRLLTYPLDSLGNWYGPIGPNSAATLAACFRYLSSERRDWDLLDLPYTDRDRLDLGRTNTAIRNLGWKPLERVWREVPTVRFDGSWDEFLARKRSEVRRHITQAESAVAVLGQTKFHHFRADESTKTISIVSRFLDVIESLVEDGAELKRIQDLAEIADEQNVFDCSWLELDGKPVAATFSLVHGNDLEIIRVFDNLPEKTESEAILSELLHHLLKRSCQLGDETVEITMQESNLQNVVAQWATCFQNSYRYTTCPLTKFRGSLLVNFHAARNRPRPRRVELESPAKQTPTPKKRPQAVAPRVDSSPKLRVIR